MHRDAADGVLLKEGENLTADGGIIPNIRDAGDPFLHLADLLAFSMDDAHSRLSGVPRIRSVKRDRPDRIALEAALSLTLKAFSWRSLSHEG
jgi:hypothetical protein